MHPHNLHADVDVITCVQISIMKINKRGGKRGGKKERKKKPLYG